MYADVFKYYFYRFKYSPLTLPAPILGEEKKMI